MIETIYEEIRVKLLALDLIEAAEYFDMDNVPDSMADGSFCLGLVNMEPGDYAGATSQRFGGNIMNLKSLFKINVSYGMTADNVIQKAKDGAVMVENVIMAVLALTVGSNEKDKINFVGSSSAVKGSAIITEINFGIDYRISAI